jgi:hypothetical protein
VKTSELELVNDTRKQAVPVRGDLMQEWIALNKYRKRPVRPTNQTLTTTEIFSENEANG